MRKIFPPAMDRGTRNTSSHQSPYNTVNMSFKKPPGAKGVIHRALTQAPMLVVVIILQGYYS